MTPPADPFSFKQHSKLHPGRLWFTVKARLAEKLALRNFKKYHIPLRQEPGEMPAVSVYMAEDTAVTPSQMQVLLRAVMDTEALEASRVEIGVYRGMTTAILAAQTKRDYVAVDPYIGYGGAESDFEKMRQRTGNVPHLRHLRMTSGAAAAGRHVERASFVFIDAVHDYVNASFDAHVWGDKLVPGGLLAFHDTDSTGFPGVQRAVWELLHRPSAGYVLHAHVDGLVVLKRI